MSRPWMGWRHRWAIYRCIPKDQRDLFDMIWLISGRML